MKDIFKEFHFMYRENDTSTESISSVNEGIIKDFMNRNKKGNQTDKTETSSLSKEESSTIFKDMKDLADTIYSKIRSLDSNLNIHEAYKFSNSQGFCIDIIYSDVNSAYENDDDSDYKELESKDDTMVNKCLNKLSAILKNIKFSYNKANGKYESDEDKYKYIHLEFHRSEDTMGVYSIMIRCSKKLTL